MSFEIAHNQLTRRCKQSDIVMSIVPAQARSRLVHINGQSITSSNRSTTLDEVENYLNRKAYDLFAISETWLKEHILHLWLSRYCGTIYPRMINKFPEEGSVSIYRSIKFKYKIVFRVTEKRISESLLWN